VLAIKFLNDQTGTPEKGNYKYEVVVTQITDGKFQWVKIDEGELKDHQRDLGWEELVKKLSDQLQNEKYLKLATLYEAVDPLK
jgi:hypothetical protein